jgi:hypothetical protein
MDAYAASGKMDGKDPLMPGKEFIVKPFKFKNFSYVDDLIEKGAKIKVPDRIRFRKEDGFTLMNIRWANTIEITNEEADFFIERQKSKTTFTFDDFSKIGTSNRLAGFVCKEALVSDEIKIDVRKTGVNIDPVKLPNLSDPNVKKSHPNLEL